MSLFARLRFSIKLGGGGVTGSKETLPTLSEQVFPSGSSGDSNFLRRL